MLTRYSHFAKCFIWFNAKVALEIATANGYCATKTLYYYGVKLHILAEHKPGKLPHPEYIGLTNAGMDDRKAFEIIIPGLGIRGKYSISSTLKLPGFALA